MARFSGQGTASLSKPALISSVAGNQSGSMLKVSNGFNGDDGGDIAGGTSGMFDGIFYRLGHIMDQGCTCILCY